MSPCVLVHAHELVQGYKEHLPRFLVVFTVEPEGNKRSNDSKQHTVHIVNWVTVNHIKISESMKNRSSFYSEHSLIKWINHRHAVVIHIIISLYVTNVGRSKEPLTHYGTSALRLWSRGPCSTQLCLMLYDPLDHTPHIIY